MPALEAPRVAAADQLFSLLPWSDVEDPLELVTSLLPGSAAGGTARRLAISDRAWTTTVLALQRRRPDATWIEASTVTSPIRAVKDASELDALRLAAAAADRVAAVLQAGEIPLVGSTESAVSARIAALLIEEGHQQVNFAIVGSGPNAASPHHEAGARLIGRGETVVCDFGGSYSVDGDVGYCSDITRTVVTGQVPSDVDECYQVLPRPSSGPSPRPGRECRPSTWTTWPVRSSKMPASEGSSCTGPATASGSRNTRIRTWWPGTPSTSGRVMHSRWNRASTGPTVSA